MRAQEYTMPVKLRIKQLSCVFDWTLPIIQDLLPILEHFPKGHRL